jgi:endonuclease YncB( thermonuclease family)
LIAGILAAVLVVGADSTVVDHRAESRPTIIGPARLIDGDTLEVANRRIRLYGIDALEMAQICRDNAGGICGIRDTPDIGAWLVGAEWAVAYEWWAQVYRIEEQAAEAAKRGLWGGSFERPSDWRASRRG